MRIPLWLKLFWTAWVIVWAPAYWREYGPQNFFSSAISAICSLPLLFGWKAR